ncbi:MauE/DoxX family redox-associated membrane protein [Pedobacter hiemivivus]|uniref:MauE/DoxX family redox-associated membrane protein n=1 Tax=Pedobacter hiemivivus TaxID=2530454 RepID=UPI0026AD7AF7
MDSSLTKYKSFRLSNSAREITVFVICCTCMFLFLFSAFEKIVEHQRFYNGLSNVSIIGSKAEVISYFVPMSEVLISILLIIPKTHKVGLYGFTLLMGIFTAYIVGMWLWASRLPCLCNLIVENLSWGQHIWFNIVFIVLAITALVLSKTNIES